MAKARKHIAPDRAEWMSWSEIYQHVRKRNLFAPPQSSQADIIKAWHDGRLPLVASEECCYRRLSPLKPLVWSKRPSLDDHDIEVVAGVVFVIPRRELRPREAYLPDLPGSGFPPTAIKGPDRGVSLVDPPDLKKPVEVLADQAMPGSISLADIKFDWIAGTANWHDKATGAITVFRGVKAKRVDVERMWLPIGAQSTKRWLKDEVERMRDSGEIQKGIGQAELARLLRPRLDAAARAGLAKNLKAQKYLEQLLKQAGAWPVD
jgi:hypothetical protein